MNTKKSIPLVMILVLALTTLACGFSVNLPNTVEGNGRVEQETREIGSFDKIELRGLGQVYVELGEEEALEISGEENLLPYMETYTQDNTLIIEIEENQNLVPTEPLEFFITAVELKELSISGLGDIELPAIETDNFNITISGAGDIEMEELVADSLDVRLSGLGNLNINGGSVAQQDITISGSGNYNSRLLDSTETQVKISGLGSATVTVSDYLTVDISGGGNVNYYGNPEVDSDISGLGDLDHQED